MHLITEHLYCIGMGATADFFSCLLFISCLQLCCLLVKLACQADFHLTSDTCTELHMESGESVNIRLCSLTLLAASIPSEVETSSLARDWADWQIPSASPIT